MEAEEFTNTGDVKNIETLKKLIKFILNRKDSLCKTEIVKICFLIDKYYTDEKKSKEGPSTVTYVKYFYGPYSDAFPDALSQLEKEGLIKNEAESSFLHKYEYVLKKKISNNEITDEEVLEIIKKTLKEVKGKSLNEIKEIVYSFKEVKEAEFGETIEFTGGNSNDSDSAQLEIQN